MTTRRILLRTLLALLLAPSTLPYAAGQTPSTRDLPPMRLRGFGELSAKITSGKTARDEAVSWLAISCEDETKAGIVHAKYVSDLHLLGEITDRILPLAGIRVPVFLIPRQGMVSAFRDGRVVHVVASPTMGGLMDGLASLERKGTLAKAELMPRGKVPMFLDAWDKHGFRFYYRPWETPKDAKWKDYKVLGEFDFAKQQGDRGFIFWAETSQVDNAAGLDNDVWWDWAARVAIHRNLPIVINTSTAEPTWMLNGHRDQLMSLMPQFCGSYHSVADPWSAGMRSISSCATSAKDAQLAPIRRIAARYSKVPCTLEYLEPHGELRHGDYDMFLEYGPVADASYRVYLRTKYRNATNVAARWGMKAAIHTWEDVRVPDLASFLGYDADAIDLTGQWRIGYEPKPEQAVGGKKPSGPNPILAPAEWFGEKFDDSPWPAIAAPGNDRMMFLDKRPAVFRRLFEVPKLAARLPKGLALHLGPELGRAPQEQDCRLTKRRQDRRGPHAARHVALGRVRGQRCTPRWHQHRRHQGTPRIPRLSRLPFKTPTGAVSRLARRDAARWVDFADWRQWTRLEAARRGLEAIRSIDPNRSILCMAPDDTVAGIKKLCERYGAHFHNTGHMGAFLERVPSDADARCRSSLLA